MQTLARRAARAAAGRALRALAAGGVAGPPKVPEEEVDFPKSIVAEVSEADVAAGLEGFVPAALRGRAGASGDGVGGGGRAGGGQGGAPPPPPLPFVLIGHAASFTPY